MPCRSTHWERVIALLTTVVVWLVASWFCIVYSYCSLIKVFCKRCNRRDEGKLQWFRHQLLYFQVTVRHTARIKYFPPVQRELTSVAVMYTITTTNVVDLTIRRQNYLSSLRLQLLWILINIVMRLWSVMASVKWKYRMLIVRQVNASESIARQGQHYVYLTLDKIYNYEALWVYNTPFQERLTPLYVYIYIYLSDWGYKLRNVHPDPDRL